MNPLRESQKQSQKLMQAMTRLAVRYSIPQEDLVRLSERAAYFCHWNALGHAEGEAERSVADFVALLREMRQRFRMKPEDALEFAHAAIGFSVEHAWQTFLSAPAAGASGSARPLHRAIRPPSLAAPCGILSIP